MIDFISTLLALYSWQKFRHHGINGVLAGIFMMRNRVKAGWFGGDWLAVLLDIQRTISKEAPLPDVRDMDFQEILHRAGRIYNDESVDNLTNGGIYTTEDIEPGIGDGLNHTATVGQLMFYRKG